MPIPRLPPILVSSSEVLLERKPGFRHTLLPFTKGRLIPAEVLKLISSRQALLSLDGTQVLAKTFVPLKPGQQILLQVERSGEQPVFRLIPDTDPSAGQPGPLSGLLRSGGATGAFGLLESLLGRELRAQAPGTLDPSGPSNRAGTFSRLRELVTSLSLKSGEPVPRFLTDLIRGSGLLWESKLHHLLSASGGKSGAELSALVEKDIKALALKLLDTGTAAKDASTDMVKSFVDGLENLQMFNRHTDDTPGRYLLPLPVWTGGELKFGQMLFTLGEGRTEEEGQKAPVVNVSFLLTLSRLGDLRADFSVLNRVISGTFGVGTKEIEAFVTAHLPGLARRLQAHGYDVRHVGCRVLAPDSLCETALLAPLLEEVHDGVLNLVI
jgi:hypothetical protein